MDSSNYSTSLIKLFIALAFASHACGCYNSIFNFGDSLSDTGNLFTRCISNEPPSCCFSPYGETFFGRPTGRCSNGRLIVDFISEALGLPLLQPYMEIEKINAEDFWKGLNFAVKGATALDELFLQEKDIFIHYGNYTLRVQVEWFKKTFSSICPKSSMCKEILGNSLILLGEIGGNDYNYQLSERRNFEEIHSFVPIVVEAIGLAITDLIEVGAKTLMVPGTLPFGCFTKFLSIYKTAEKEQYDPQNGCLKWLNEFSEYHSEQLQMELERIRARYPSINIIYADYYNAAMRLFNDPRDFGFTNTLDACCMVGSGSFNVSARCGAPLTNVCEDPSKYIDWDGAHLTEAAYKLITTSLLEGSYTTPNIRTLCDVTRNGAADTFAL